jgi:hypothetical protein
MNILYIYESNEYDVMMMIYDDIYLQQYSARLTTITNNNLLCKYK